MIHLMWYQVIIGLATWTLGIVLLITYVLTQEENMYAKNSHSVNYNIDVKPGDKGKSQDKD